MDQARKPSKDDPSRPTEHGYAYKKQFYRESAVASDYDFHRFGEPRRVRRNIKKWKAICKALDETDGVESVLDIPCGTGRFTGSLAERGHLVIGSDISLEMMVEAQSKFNDLERFAGYVQADAEALPMPDSSVDCVMSIRFMFHVDPATRVRILREMGRVSRRWLIIDYRHCYTPRYLKWKIKSALRMTKTPLERVSRREMEDEFREAGIKIRRVIPVARVFSDKWIVVGESPHNA
ncbi:MAG: class I SAM-dependent methyltransferase [Acidobacteriota bacterium]|nr:class I SAM-dependent methyltransferase [Acidobacteriota bacterium]MDH3784942.1 class I SAM-dependent methyltransferase [Acidobacteriota bacterium]